MRESKRVKIALAVALLITPIPGCKKSDAPQSTSKAAANGEHTRLYITVQDVKVRSGPGTRYKIIAEIKGGYTVNVTGQEGEWLRVVSKHGKPPGYIDHRFARPTGPENAPMARSPRGTYKTTADIPVREGPGMHYRSVATIPQETKVMVVGAEGDWLKVQSQHGNPPGYIERRYAEQVPG